MPLEDGHSANGGTFGVNGASNADSPNSLTTGFPGAGNRMGMNQMGANTAVWNSPWFQEAYHNAQEFYEKDKVLDPIDWLELSKIYLSIARAQLWSGWAAFGLVTSVPFVLQYKKTGGVKGTKVSRAFAFGFLSMFAATQAGGSLMYKSKLASIRPETLEDDPNVPKSSRQKQYEMMKLLNMGMPTRWATYFNLTYRNPEKRIPDPKLTMEKLKNGQATTRNRSVMFDNKDPMGLYTGPQFEKKEGVPKAGAISPPAQKVPQQVPQNDEYDPFNEEDNKEEESLSAWDRIRKENAVADTKAGNSWEEIRKKNYDNSPK